jgi:ribosomal protein L27
MILSFLTPHDPPEKRRRYCVDGIEQKLSEGAVQVAFALYLLDHPEGGTRVEIFPDGEHAKRFAIPAFLERCGFSLGRSIGATAYGGEYVRGSQILVVNPKSQHGRGDVVGTIADTTVRAECKGGIINSRHSGALSKLRSGFSELIGQTLAMEVNGDRHVAVAPRTTASVIQAARLRARALKAGIEIALVAADGSIEFV